MELALNILTIAIFILVLCYVASLVWDWKKGSIASKITKIVITGLLFILDILTLIFEIYLGKIHVVTILFLVLLVCNLCLNTFLLGKKWQKNNCECKKKR